jgi:hypothetical protein
MERSTNMYDKTDCSTFSNFEPFLTGIHITGYAPPDAIISWPAIVFSSGAE